MDFRRSSGSAKCWHLKEKIVSHVAATERAISQASNQVSQNIETLQGQGFNAFPLK